MRAILSVKSADDLRELGWPSGEIFIFSEVNEGVMLEKMEEVGVTFPTGTPQ
jgi:hypothetical protein